MFHDFRTHEDERRTRAETRLAGVVAVLVERAPTEVLEREAARLEQVCGKLAGQSERAA